MQDSKCKTLNSFNKHIIVAGSARSGTSWLAEIIGLQFRYRLLFEPEHEFRTKDGYLICDKFVTEDNITNAQDAYFINIFKNKIDSDWIAQISNRKFKMHLWPILPKKYVIKFVRGNLSAAFMNTHFNIPILFIIRNPYDVIFSQNRVKFPWLYDLSHFEKQDELTNVLKNKYNFSWNEIEHFTEIQKLTFRWCIENHVVFDIQKTNSTSFKLIKYEDLKADVNLFYEICNNFNIKPLENIKSIYDKPSSKTHPKSDIRKKIIDNNKVNEETILEINSVLDLFSVTLYPRR